MYILQSPLLDNYHFNPNRKMTSGYCSIIVKKVDRAQHQGEWTCAAKLIGSDSECSDEFRVTVYDSNISVAGISGMAFAVTVLIGVIAFVTYQRYRRTYNNPRRSTRQTVVTYIASTDAISINSNRSTESQSSSQIDGSQFEGIQLHTISLN